MSYIGELPGMTWDPKSGKYYAQTTKLPGASSQKRPIGKQSERLRQGGKKLTSNKSPTKRAIPPRILSVIVDCPYYVMHQMHANALRNFAVSSEKIQQHWDFPSALSASSFLVPAQDEIVIAFQNAPFHYAIWRSSLRQGQSQTPTSYSRDAISLQSAAKVTQLCGGLSSIFALQKDAEGSNKSIVVQEERIVMRSLGKHAINFLCMGASGAIVAASTLLTSDVLTTSIFPEGLDDILTLTGLRAGTLILSRFDRNRELSQTKIASFASPIVILHTLNDGDILVGLMTGQLHVYRLDIINLRLMMVADLQGHCNEQHLQLPHCLSRDHRFFVALGSDGYLRLWSLVTFASLSDHRSPKHSHSLWSKKWDLSGPERLISIALVPFHLPAASSENEWCDTTLISEEDCLPPSLFALTPRKLYCFR